MNLRQKSYESINATNRLLKLTNSYYHSKNLELIKNRKPKFVSKGKEIFGHKSKYLQPCKDYFVIRSNATLISKINDMRWRPANPKINTFFLEKEKKIQDFRQRYQIIDKKAIKNENINYKKRIKNQKPFLSTKNIDKDFKENHTKTLEKLRQVSENDNCSVLPIIRSPNATNIKYFKTEGNKKSKRNEGSESGSGSNVSQNKDGDSAYGSGIATDK